MKSFSIHHMQGVIVVAVSSVVFGFAYFLGPSFFEASKVGAASTDNVSGWAWANTPQSAGTPTTGTDQGLGWISFNNTTDGSATAYGVNVDSATGNFSGYAYIGNGSGQGDTGWIHFAPVGPYPELPNYSARRVGNTVTGWAKALSITGGFDGWIKLSGTATNGSTYGVTIATDGTFSGKAWGDSVLGWIDFAPTVGGVLFGVKLDVPVVCTDALATISSNVCEPPTGCPSGESFTNGTMILFCPPPVGGSVLKACSGTCPIITPTPACDNDTICEIGETLLNCPRDCKGKVQQF